MPRTSTIAGLLLVSTALLGSCGGPPCRSQSDCGVGSYCVLDISGAGQPKGQCVFDCLEHDDCPQPDSNITRAICTNTGECRTEALPPRLVITEPEIDQLYAEGTRTMRVTGEVTTAAPSVSLTVNIVAESGCGGAVPRSVTVENPVPGERSTIPFVVDGLSIDPGTARLDISASVLGTTRSRRVPFEVACDGCVDIRIEQPFVGMSVTGLELPTLAGTIPGAVQAAIWRVHSTTGDIFDGVMPVSNGRFRVDRLPLFQGANRLEVVATPGRGVESRCSSLVNSGVALERGLRALLVWDGPTSDLDLHVVGPGGSFGDAATSLSARSRQPFFGGAVLDDAVGYGPEIVTIEDPLPGVYGFIVEPVANVSDPGASAFLRILYNGRLIQRGPIGPAYLSADLGLLWVAGRVTIDGSGGVWDEHDQLVPASPLPNASPENWPPYGN